MRTEEILHISAALRGEHPAIIGRRGITSYAELSLISHQIAEALKQAQVTPGTIIGISLLDAKEFVAALFGTLEAGCVPIPISPQLPGAEQERVIQDTQVSQTILAFQNADLLPNESPLAIQTLPTLALRREAPSRYDILSIFPDAAVIRHTSGTTAKSKGVVLSHKSVLERTEASLALLKLTENDVVLAPLPLSYHFVASALSFLRAGATIVDCVGLSPSEILELGAKHGATVMYGSPIQYELMSRAVTEHSLPQLRNAISTSALLPATTASLFQSRFGVRLTQVYGVIEVGLPLWNTDPHDPPTALGRCPHPYKCAVVDEHGAEVVDGEIGELLVRGPGLFVGYLCGEHAGTSLPDNAWFHTGDIVTRNEQGTITYKGRKKSVINCAGNKIFPEEVEEVLMQANDIQQAHVFAEPHPLLGHLVVAEIVVTPGMVHNTRAWQTLCYNQLSGFKVPKEFRIVSKLSITGSGKVVRHTPQLEEAAA